MHAVKLASEGSTVALKPRTEVQNRGIGGLTKRTDVLQQFFKTIILCQP